MRISQHLRTADLASLGCMRAINAKIHSLPNPRTSQKSYGTLRSSIAAAFSTSGGDMLASLKAIRKADSQTFDDAAEHIRTAEKRAKGFLDAISYLTGKTDELTDDVPAEILPHIVELKAARQATGSMISPSIESELRQCAQAAHGLVKHHAALHAKRWAAYRVALNKQASQRFDAAAKMPGNDKSAVHLRAAKRYAVQAERASVQYQIANDKFNEVKHG